MIKWTLQFISIYHFLSVKIISTTLKYVDHLVINDIEAWTDVCYNLNSVVHSSVRVLQAQANTII